jgi:hypothetical protein
METKNTPLKILIISDFDAQNANVINDFLFCFNKHSRHEYYYIFNPQTVGESIDLSAFDVILMFWSIYLPGASLSNAVRQKIHDAKALKVLFLQDEYRDVRIFNRLMAELGVQVMFTCVAEEYHNVFYPKELIPSLQAVYTVLTGYVPSYLEVAPPSDSWERPIDIGYRSRALPYYLGDIGREKIMVAERFQEISTKYGFHSDISVREEDRIYGKAWIDFTRSSRFTLGSASGASVIDFTGEIRRNCDNYLALNPGASYAEVKSRFFAQADGRYAIDTVSPRIFESAALGCVMVMHEGFYGGILQPGVHYICVKKDYSNIQDVVAQMKDSAFTRQIAANAYRDLIASGTYSYRTFAKWFDGVLEKHASPVSQKKISRNAFYATRYFKAGQTFFPKGDSFFSLPGRKILGYFRKFDVLEQNVRLYLPFLAMWRLLFQYFRMGVWKQVPLKYLVMDFSRLGLIRSMLSGQKLVAADFRVRSEYKPEQSMLRFVSYDLSSDVPKAGSNDSMRGFELSQFMNQLQNNQALFEWDHSAIGTHLEYRYGRKVRALDMGADGHYRFQTIIRMIQYFPDLVAAILRPLIGRS